MALIAVEIVARLAFDFPTIDTMRPHSTRYGAEMWVDHPFLPYVGRGGLELVGVQDAGDDTVLTELRTNAFGFRTHEFPTAPKAPAEFRVFCLGGSTTLGAAAESAADTWPGLLEARLASRYPDLDVRVYNLGMSGASTAFSVVNAALLVAHMEPDLVIVYQGYNDAGPIGRPDYRDDHAHFFRDLDLEGSWPGVQRSLPRWLFASWALSYVTFRMDQHLEMHAMPTDTQTDGDLWWPATQEGLDRRWRRGWRHLETIAAIADGAGARALFSTFQFFDGDDSSRTTVNRTLRALFAERGYDYVDIDAAIENGRRDLQWDQCHFTRAGRELVAGLFFEHIERAGWLDRVATGGGGAATGEGGVAAAEG